MIRSWGLVTLTGAAQPWFGDVTTAAVGLPSSEGIIPVTVASTTRYRVGDRIYLDPGAADQDMLMVDSIPNLNGTILNCRSEGESKTHTHVTSTIIALSIPCTDILIQSNAAGAVWLGTDSTVTSSGGGSGFYQIQPLAAPAQPPEFRLAPSLYADSNRTSDGWMIGTSTQKVAVAARVL